MTPVFSTYQMQILDSISKVDNDNDLCVIKNMIAQYFSEKALNSMDALCEQGVLNTQTIQSWKNEHLRTSYK